MTQSNKRHVSPHDFWVFELHPLIASHLTGIVQWHPSGISSCIFPFLHFTLQIFSKFIQGLHWTTTQWESHLEIILLLSSLELYFPPPLLSLNLIFFLLLSLFSLWFPSSHSLLWCESVAQQYSTFLPEVFLPLSFTDSSSDHLAPEPSVSLFEMTHIRQHGFHMVWFFSPHSPKKKWTIFWLLQCNSTHTRIRAETHRLTFLYLVPCERLCEEGPNLWSIFIVWSINWAHKHAGNAYRVGRCVCGCVLVHLSSCVIGFLLFSFTWIHITSLK